MGEDAEGRSPRPQDSESPEDFVEANRATWNGWSRWNAGSDYYALEQFRAGTRTLDDVELAGFPDVAGKTLLHLQCQLGTESLSWAERGAVVTGVDFSAEAIRAARALSAETGIAAEFLESDVYQLPEVLDRRFDRVFTSHGVLLWLPDMTRWAEVIAHFLAPGGLFYIVEAHPLALMFDNDRTDGRLVFKDPYFHSAKPQRQEEAGHYAWPARPDPGETFIWFHSLSEIVGALLAAGLEIRSFHEYPFMGWRLFPWMIEDGYNHWRLPEGAPDIPLGFSLLAEKPQGR